MNRWINQASQVLPPFSGCCGVLRCCCNVACALSTCGRELLQKGGAHGRRGCTKVSSLATASLCTMPPRTTGSRQCGQTGRWLLRRKGSRHSWHNAEWPLQVIICQWCADWMWRALIRVTWLLHTLYHMCVIDSFWHPKRGTAAMSQLIRKGTSRGRDRVKVYTYEWIMTPWHLIHVTWLV